MVSVLASHRKSPEICPQPVYKQDCAEKIILKITGSPEYTGTDVLVKSVVSRQCVHTMSPKYRWVPAQVSTSSLDRGSKLRGPVVYFVEHG